MKKITYVMMFAAAAAATLVSCNKEADNFSQREGIKVTVIAANPETKTTLGANGKTISWNSTDRFGFVNVATPLDNEATITSIDVSGAATITGTVASAGTYFAYYPKSTYDATSDGGVLRIKTAQSPASGTSFDPAADVLVSETFEVAESGSATAPATVSFKRLGAFLKVYFVDATTGSRLSGEYATSVSVQSDGAGAQSLAAKLTVNSTGIVSAAGAEKTIKATYGQDVFELTNATQAAYLGIQPLTLPKDSQLIINVETRKYTISKTVTLPADVTIGSGEMQPIGITVGDENLVSKIQTVWAMQSTGSTAWNTVFGGTGGSDRNIAMDDDYVYVAENTAAAKLWAISIADNSVVKAVNVTGVSGGAHALACPRVIPNTNPSVNGGKDVLVCSNLTRGGEDPKLYLWLNGIDSDPAVVTLTTYATAAWYGDVFTVYGTLQDGILFFDKTGGDGVNGVVTFDLSGVPGDKLYLHKRIDFVTAYGSHSGACAYYPVPGNPNVGVYSPGRGVEGRGKSSTFEGDLKSDGNSKFDPVLTNLDYAEGRNGFVLGYNFIEWNGKRYVIYGKQESSTNGKVYILEGTTGQSWIDIANTASVKFRRDDLVRLDGCTLSSGNSGMDVTARVIGDALYIAAQKQNLGCAVYRIDK